MPVKDVPAIDMSANNVPPSGPLANKMANGNETVEEATTTAKTLANENETKPNATKSTSTNYPQLPAGLQNRPADFVCLSAFPHHPYTDPNLSQRIPGYVRISQPLPLTTLLNLKACPPFQAHRTLVLYP